MKTIGLIGGMSWESTAVYYRLINELVAERIGGLHSAKCILWSFDFAEIEALQHVGDWGGAATRMADAGRALADAGADFLVICTNTMHKLAEAVAAAADRPVLHIADATGDRIRADGRRTVGLLATRFTMEEDFYRGRLAARHGLAILTPGAADRTIVHDIIYNELCRGEIRDASRAQYGRIISELVGRGAECIVLGCTEIGLLIRPDDSPVPVYDTTILHAEAAVRAALDVAECSAREITAR